MFENNKVNKYWGLGIWGLVIFLIYKLKYNNKNKIRKINKKYINFNLKWLLC